MRIFITGSADGLGQMAAEQLIELGHEVVLHARDAARANEAIKKVPGAKSVMVADVTTIKANLALAEELNASGAFDAVIHNAAVGYRESRRIETEDGLPHVFAINTLSPFILTATMLRPKRLVYLSSGLHRSGDPTLSDLTFKKRRWSGSEAYSDSKLHDAMLAAAVARYWPEVRSNALEPGWVATKMGGAGAPDDLSLGATTQVWLAQSDDPAAAVSGRYFYHQKEKEPLAAVNNARLQDLLVAQCEQLSGVALSRS